MDKFKEGIYLYIGRNIKNLRREKGLSQETLSNLLVISRSSLSNIESGRHHVSLSTLYMIANYLEIEISSLLPSLEDIKLQEKKASHNYLKYLEPDSFNSLELDSLGSVIDKIISS
ncbi:MAG: helix-turn-helix domain-containing protein [Flavobacteriales bacterium]|jgi:transcriptional regulator with XRE-family HTH domain|nr:helix-turn-helix domain-containing protein [Flavobacteriales bacterium]